MFYYKIRHNDCPLYLTEYIPIFAFVQITLQIFLSSELNILSQQFSTHPHLTELDPNIQKKLSIDILKQALIKFTRTKPALIYKIHHPRELNLVTRLRLGLKVTFAPNLAKKLNSSFY